MTSSRPGIIDARARYRAAARRLRNTALANLQERIFRYRLFIWTSFLAEKLSSQARVKTNGVLRSRYDEERRNNLALESQTQLALTWYHTIMWHGMLSNLLRLEISI